MSARQSKEDAFTVADSTDWLSTPLASLSAVEAAMRCQVCKDFYQTPMITSCMHTFCSVCIRRCLSTEGKCPACRSSDQELKLRFNGAMEEAVQAFIKGREVVLDFARTPKEQVIVEVPERRKRRDRSDMDIEDEDTPRKRTRATTRQQSQSQSQPQTSQSQRERVVVADSDDDGGDFLPEGFTHCPVCSAEVEIVTINAHLDRGCVDPSTPKPRKSTFQQPTPILSSKPAEPLQRLPQVNYSMLKDVPLRKKLTDAGLSAAGSRQLLQQRYSEWITLWNANCDATKPKTKNELKREMDIWERTQGGRSMGSTAGSHIRDKDFDGAAWSTKHDGDFKSLIANARKKIVKPAISAEKKDTDPILSDREVTPRDGTPGKQTSVPSIEDGSKVNGTGSSAPALTNSNSSVPVKEGSQRSRYFQEKDTQDDGEICPPSSQQIVT